MDIKAPHSSDEMGEDDVVDGLLRELREAAPERPAETGSGRKSESVT